MDTKWLRTLRANSIAPDRCRWARFRFSRQTEYPGLGDVSCGVTTMKNCLGLLTLALLGVPAQAQLFGPESLTGAALGGVTGAVIGHNSGRHGGEGAAIGAGIGAVLGAFVGEERRRSASTVYESPTYAPVISRPNYAISGAVLGGVAGAVIGHNQGRRGAEGAAIGAASGLLLGTLAEHSARRREWVAQPAPTLLYQPVLMSSATAVPQPVEPPTPAPASVVSVSIASQSSSGANSLFGR